MHMMAYYCSTICALLIDGNCTLLLGVEQAGSRQEEEEEEEEEEQHCDFDYIVTTRKRGGRQLVCA